MPEIDEAKLNEVCWMFIEKHEQYIGNIVDHHKMFNNIKPLLREIIVRYEE
jgi:hypothetical protein